MSMKVLLYGNCQVSKLIHSGLFTQCKVENILCYATNISQKSFLNTIKDADIIITQPIKSDYRGKNYLGTDYICKHRKKDSVLLMIPSIFGGVYFPDLVYVKNNLGGLVTNPCDYHYLNLIKYYLSKKPVNMFYDEVFDNSDYIDNAELSNHISTTIQLISNKEQVAKETYPDANFIDVSNYIRDNWVDKLLFYSVNHPTNYIYNYILNNIVDRELVKISNCGMEKTSYPENIYTHIPGEQRGIMYKSVRDQLKFDINCYKPCMNGITDNYKIINEYYTSYNEHGTEFEPLKYSLDKFTYRNNIGYD